MLKEASRRENEKVHLHHVHLYHVHMCISQVA